MFKGLSNLTSMIKQAKEMGGKMQGIGEELKSKRATGAAGGGMVEVDINGLTEVLAIRIEQSLVDQADREMLEDLVAAAVNQAVNKSKQMHAEAISSMTGGIQLPGLSEALESLSGQVDDEETTTSPNSDDSQH